MDAGREFLYDGAALLKARFPNDVLLNDVYSSGMDDGTERPRIAAATQIRQPLTLVQS